MRYTDLLSDFHIHNPVRVCALQHRSHQCQAFACRIQITNILMCLFVILRQAFKSKQSKSH